MKSFTLASVVAWALLAGAAPAQPYESSLVARGLETRATWSGSLLVPRVFKEATGALRHLAGGFVAPAVPVRVRYDGTGIGRPGHRLPTVQSGATLSAKESCTKKTANGRPDCGDEALSRRR
ncbi:hypothetical protein C8J56DRAFT_1073021 [Mycena floridula]|nr:hypothetical protein C8J56DRAFT_1073021 [Mycena floridula]